MKTIFSGILSAAAVAALAGCAPADKYLRADPASIEMAAESGEISIAVEASASWMFDGAAVAEWFSPEYDDDDPNLLWVSAQANENPYERTDSMILVSGDGSRLIIPLRQLAMDVFFGVSPAVPEPFAARDDTVRTLTVSTNLTSGWNYTILHASDWLTAEIGEDDEDNILTLAAKRALSSEERRDTIIVRPNNEAYAALADSIAVVQAGLEIEPEPEPDPDPEDPEEPEPTPEG